jgi:polyhydroxyalkanoate synthesis regulator phasin
MFLSNHIEQKQHFSGYMFMGLFSTDPVKKLEKQHKKLLEEAFQMSKIDRTKSDALTAKAAELEEQLLKLKNK